jgi:hypothetical protein
VQSVRDLCRTRLQRAGLAGIGRRQALASKPTSCFLQRQ